MQDKSSYLLAADSEIEMEEWINTLNKILQLNFEAAMQEKRNGESHEGKKGFQLCWYTYVTMLMYVHSEIKALYFVCLYKGFIFLKFICLWS